MRREIVVGVIALVAAGVAAAVALAGGWAVTTVHPLGSRPTAGTPLRVTFTIRQHGVRPVEVADTAIEITGADGRTTRFDARPLARTGRYAADVVFPSAGTWRWRAVQGWFAPQALGTIRVSRPGAKERLPALDGRSLFRSKGCATCHAGPESSSFVGAGPSLFDAAERFGGTGGLAYIRQSILAPNAVIASGGVSSGGPVEMPRLEVTRAEADAIARYLQTTRPR